ncbi:MAG: molybdate ABC transporter permease subunit [Gemmatimonadales bacterium]
MAGVATALIIVTGLPVAWALARRRFPGRGLLEAAVVMPLVLPPTVLGYYLLVLIGRTGPIGRMADAIGVELAFTWRAAVIAAWVGAFGLFVKAAQGGLEAVDPRLEQAARTLGRSEWSVFASITLPLAWRSVLAGTIIAFCRSLGDFGITLMVAGSIPQLTQTVPLAIYDHVQAGRLAAANQLSLVVLGLVGALVLAVGRLTRLRL